MAGMEFEYDEEGGTFFYFLISFWALVLIPCTYFLWPVNEKKDEEEDKKRCECPPCQRKIFNLSKEKASIKPTVIKISLAVGWVIFLLLAWKVSTIQLDYVEYDPFFELSIERGATTQEIKKAYRTLSKVFHPDMETGDAKKFMRIAKAYAALTDPVSKENWELYGNPDGPTASHFGIALPAWIVKGENSMWVLALYGLVFMIILPVVVGIWWYRSIKFSGDKVLLTTTSLYYYFINKTSNMILKRAVIILAASCEFDRMHNAEIIERPTDNEELPMLIKQLQNVQEKIKERPLCFTYSLKARTLLLAYFQRVPLNPNTLQIDQDYILRKCPYLINDMVTICAQLVAMAMSGRVSQQPRLDSIENIMKMSQMVAQALDEKSSPLQQLPHITPDMLRHFTTRKRNIRHIRDFVNMKQEDRRLMLRTLTDEEYTDVMTVCAQMPYIEMKVRTEVLDEEDTTITARSIVTVTVSLVRKDMGEMFDQELSVSEAAEDASGEIEGVDNEEENEEEEADEDGNQGDAASAADKGKAWEKNKGKGKKKGAGKAKKKTKQVYQWKQAAQAKVDSANAAAAEAELKGTAETDSPKPKKSPKAEKKDAQDEEEADDVSEEEGREEKENASEEEEEKETVQENTADEAKPSKTKKSDDDDDDEDWDNYKMESKKENSLDTKKKESHLVHCPYFPGEKQEAWWVYVADRKHHWLITAPVHVCTLKTEEEVQLKFSAPDKPGIYQFTVCLRSDSYYLDFDQSQTIKLDVKEAKVVKDHPQWDISEDEDEKDKEDDDDSEDDDSDYSSEEEYSD